MLAMRANCRTRLNCCQLLLKFTMLKIHLLQMQKVLLRTAICHNEVHHPFSHWGNSG